MKQKTGVRRPIKKYFIVNKIKYFLLYENILFYLQ